MTSRGTPDLSWAGSTQLGPDLARAVREIRDRHEHVKVVGSLNLVQTLLREKLFDRLDLWAQPIAASGARADAAPCGPAQMGRPACSAAARTPRYPARRLTIDADSADRLP